jgi:hypothetical protein
VDLPSAIGLGLDIAGAAVITIGLLGSPATFALRATTFLGGNSHTAAAEAESRADAEFGLPVLLSGFLGQLIGLSVHSEAPVCIGYPAAALCALLPLATWHWLWRPWRRKRLAVEIARYRVKDSRSTPQRSDHPDLGTLVSLGIGLGEPFSSGETDEDYAVRVFNVANVISRDS